MKLKDSQASISYSQADISATRRVQTKRVQTKRVQKSEKLGKLKKFNLDLIHPSWRDYVERALLKVDQHYLQELVENPDWLPGSDKIFHAFSLPLTGVKYVLFGESPYPRPQSANGFAFWDASVTNLWSETGLSKRVNRATSLRHLLKMLLIAEGVLNINTLNQAAIAAVDKKPFVQSGHELFSNFLRKGFLLLNTSLVFHKNLPPSRDAKAWRPFIKEVLNCLIENRPNTQFIFFGRIANSLHSLFGDVELKSLCAEHPYNCSFPTNEKVINFFKPLHLLLPKN